MSFVVIFHQIAGNKEPQPCDDSAGNSQESDAPIDLRMRKDDQDVQVIAVIPPSRSNEVVVVDSDADSSYEKLPDLVPADDDYPQQMPAQNASPMSSPSVYNDQYEGSSTESAEDDNVFIEERLYQNQEESPEVQQVILENKIKCKIMQNISVLMPR